MNKDVVIRLLDNRISINKSILKETNNNSGFVYGVCTGRLSAYEEALKLVKDITRI